MKYSDLKNLGNAYLTVLNEDLGLGGSADAGQGAIVMGIGMPDNGPHNNTTPNVAQAGEEVESAIREAKQILQDLQNVKELEPWVLSKLATVADRLHSIHDFLANK